jgi:hypothetical protein
MELKIYINGELERLENANIEQIKHLQDYLKKLFWR